MKKKYEDFAHKLEKQLKLAKLQYEEKKYRSVIQTLRKFGNKLK